MPTDINLTDALVNQLTEAQLSGATTPPNQFWLTPDEETDDTKANIDASNLSSANVTNWHTKLNDMSTPTAGQTQTGKQAVVVDSYLSSDSKTWYRKWSDGWKECGMILDNADWGEHTVQIPIPNGFLNTNYLCVCGLAGNHTSSFGVLYSGIHSKTTTSFKTYYNNSIYSGSSGSVFKEVYCCGY